MIVGPSFFHHLTYRHAASTAAVLIFLLSAGSAPEASSRLRDSHALAATQRSPVRQPRVGEVNWSVDGISLLRWSGRDWQPTGWSRSFVMPRDRRLYDLFFNRQAVVRIDERERGWTRAIDHAGPFQGVQRRWPSNNPQAVQYLVSTQWMTVEQTLTYLVALLNRMVELERQRQPAPVRRFPCEMAPNVRCAIPTNPALMTREELQYVRKSNEKMIGMMARPAQQSACEFGQSSYAYNTTTGAIMPGWYDTVTGPMRKGC